MLILGGSRIVCVFMIEYVWMFILVEVKLV